MQKIAALSNLVCYYCIGLPVGIALMFAAKLRILGNTFHPILLLHEAINCSASGIPVILHQFFSTQDLNIRSKMIHCVMKELVLSTITVMLVLNPLQMQ